MYFQFFLSSHNNYKSKSTQMCLGLCKLYKCVRSP